MAVDYNAIQEAINKIKASTQSLALKVQAVAAQKPITPSPVAPQAPQVAPQAPQVAPQAPIVQKTITPSSELSAADKAVAQAKVATIQSQLADLQAKQKALTDYGLKDTEELTKNVSGAYVPISSGGTSGAYVPISSGGTSGAYVPISSGGTSGTLGGTSSSVMDEVRKQLGMGSDSGNDYQQQLSDLIATMKTQQSDYITALGSQQSPTDLYTQYRAQLGLPEKEAAATALNQNITKTTQMIDALEENINSRIGGSLTTEAQRDRELAVEQRPLQKQLQGLTQTAAIEQPGLASAQSQLQNLLSLAGQGQEQKLAAAKAPLDFSSQLLPLYEQMATYQSPQEKLAEQIASERISQNLGLGSSEKTTVSEPQILGSATTGYYSYDPSTGKTTKLDTGTIPVSNDPSNDPSKRNYQDVASALYNVGIPTKTATTAGAINKSYLDQLTGKGIPVDLAQAIWDAILDGTTLEEIRQSLKAQGVDPKLLDTYMMTLQGIGAGVSGGRNP